jgi:hypothetical protein
MPAMIALLATNAKKKRALGESFGSPGLKPTPRVVQVVDMRIRRRPTKTQTKLKHARVKTAVLHYSVNFEHKLRFEQVFFRIRNTEVL